MVAEGLEPKADLARYLTDVKLLLEHLDIPELVAEGPVETQDTVDIPGCRVDQEPMNAGRSGSIFNLLDQPGTDAQALMFRRDVNIINLKISFAFRYNSKAVTCVLGSYRKSNNHVVPFRHEEERSEPVTEIAGLGFDQPVCDTSRNPLHVKFLHVGDV